MDFTVEDVELLLNKRNLALARRQRIVRQWCPPSVHTQTATPAQQAEDEEEFRAVSDAAGVGSHADKGNGEATDVVFKLKATSFDRLLEQLLGKKAAHARLKMQKQGGPHAQPKALEPAGMSLVRPAVVSDEEEDEGRSAAFTSRKRPAGPVPTIAGANESAALGETVETESVDRKEDGETTQAHCERTAQEHASTSRKRPRAGGSYLDELLAKKEGKKKKRKKAADVGG